MRAPVPPAGHIVECALVFDPKGSCHKKSLPMGRAYTPIFTMYQMSRAGPMSADPMSAPRKHSTAGCAIGGFKRIMKLPGIFAHALAVMVKLLVSYQQAARQNSSTQRAAYTTTFSQRYAERCRNSNGLSITQAAVKGFVQGHYNRLGAQQLPGLIQVSCALSNLCD